MRDIIALTAVLLFAFGLAACDSRTVARVERVVDSTTFVARVGEKTETILLIGVESPPISDQSWGEDAARLSHSLIKDDKGVIGLEFDSRLRDDQGRLLAYVWTEHGMLNELLLRKGLAQVHVAPPNMKWSERLRQAQGRAMKGGIGFWKNGGPDATPAETRQLNDRIKQQATIP